MNEYGPTVADIVRAVEEHGATFHVGEDVYVAVSAQFCGALTGGAWYIVTSEGSSYIVPAQSAVIGVKL